MKPDGDYMNNILKSDHFYYSTSLLLISIFLILSGILLIVGNSTFYFNIMNIFISVILLLSIFQFLKYLFYNKNKHISFINSFIYLILGIIISSFRSIPLSFFPFVFALYMIFNGIIRMITYILLLKTKSDSRVFSLITSIIYFIIGIPLLFGPLKNISRMLIIVGVYILLLGFNFLISFVSNIIPLNIKNKLRRKVRITLPSFLAAVIPYQVLKEINNYLNENNNVSLIIKNKKENEIPNLEIFVHIAPTSYNRFGHVDICINNKVISYGAYDFSTSKFFNMIGDGMIFEVDRDRYIKYCTRYSNKTLFCFGLKLTDKQLDRVNRRIASIMNNVDDYKTLYEIDKLNHNIKQEYKNYPSKLVKRTKAKFYKIKSGTFKTFFILGVNCCRLANYIVGKDDIDILKMYGIITPGTYYEYLNQEFYKKNSIVISRTIYNNADIQKKK